ncbi:Protein of unknown function [Pyronema omphalodes CBS 100304]|uniref:Uncharacterized protein n=1 Tax=Pyronema omphalodes (strain CBS 100304) TaxID=1076935 RepID=U4LC76_PYROM|nr:Protein of unknown function [Pyronema omphalodes CBS 100304]
MDPCRSDFMIAHRPSLAGRQTQVCVPAGTSSFTPIVIGLWVWFLLVLDNRTYDHSLMI